MKQAPALYICPYCKKGFSSKDHGWCEAKRHIATKHRSRVEFVPRQLAPVDNLFGNAFSRVAGGA